MPKIPGFLPSASGFHFSNNDFGEVALAYIDYPIHNPLTGRGIPIGDASNGLCGGMVFAVRDYFEAHMPIPRDTRNPSAGPLFDYLVRRLIASFNLPAGPGIYYQLMNPNPLLPDIQRALAMNTAWPVIRANIDNGHPSAIALVQTTSANPGALGDNHVVLAYGYDLVGSDVTIYVYDPNHPDDDTVTISFNTARTIIPIGRSHNDQPIYAFFLISYDFANPSAFFGLQAAPPVAALARYPDGKHLDIWVTGNDRNVYTAYHRDDDAVPWNGWYQILGAVPNGLTSRTSVTALARYPDGRYLDIWVTGKDGTVYTAHHSDNDAVPWNGWHQVIGPVP
jgi:hypothetical protein